MKPLAFAGVLAVVCASAWAAAAGAQLQADPRLDTIASGIAGFPVTVTGEDNDGDWTAVLAQWGVQPASAGCVPRAQSCDIRSAGRST